MVEGEKHNINHKKTNIAASELKDITIYFLLLPLIRVISLDFWKQPKLVTPFPCFLIFVYLFISTMVLFHQVFISYIYLKLHIKTWIIFSILI